MPGQLDDLKFIHQIDTSDALGLASKQWQQLEHEYVLDISGSTGTIENIVHSGMGGSALWALLSMSWPGYLKPFEVVRDYDIPAYVNEKTLFIASSYSGNTEETLASLAKAEAKGAQIAIITSGGKLLDIAKEKQYTLVELPKIDKPRYGAPENPLAALGEVIGQLTSAGILPQVGSRAVLAGEKAARERETRHYREALLSGKASEVPLVIGAMHEVVVVLHGEHRRDPELGSDDPRFNESIARVVRRAKMTHLARSNEVVHRQKRLFKRNLGIVDVQVEQIDVVRLEPLERCIHRTADRLGGDSGIVGTFSDLRRDDNSRAQSPVAHPVADHDLASPARVGVGGIDEIATVFKIGVKNLVGGAAISGPAKNVATNCQREHPKSGLAEGPTDRKRNLERRKVRRGGHGCRCRIGRQYLRHCYPQNSLSQCVHLTLAQTRRARIRLTPRYS